MASELEEAGNFSWSELCRDFEIRMERIFNILISSLVWMTSQKLNVMETFVFRILCFVVFHCIES